MLQKLLLFTVCWLITSCGNYSLLEKIGPQADEDYFCFAIGNQWSYSAESTTTGSGPISFEFTNTIAPSPTFINGTFLIFSNASNPTDTGNKIAAIYPTKYGYKQIFNILYSFATNTTGAVAYPQTVSLPFIEYPFVKGRKEQTSIVQTISNFPLLQSSSLATVQIVFSSSNYVEDNNLTIEVNGNEYENCIKYHYTTTIDIRVLNNIPPYLAGDSVQMSQDFMTFYLAKNRGPVKIVRLSTMRDQNNSYSETYLKADLLKFTLK